jgi:NADPH:quinone reductase
VRRVRYHCHGGPEVLVIEQADIPDPGPGQVLVRTEAIGINFVDARMRRETAADSIYYRALPATLTGDVVGTVEQAGTDADPALVGARVAVLADDAYAEYVVADARWAAVVPEGLDAGAASMLPMIGPVALGVLRTARLAAGEAVLVTAGAGAIGHLAVQLARQQDAGIVIATAGSQAKLDFLAGLGADVAVNHREAGLAGRVRKAAPAGIDVAVDGVGGPLLRECIGLLAPFGRAVGYGTSAGEPGSLQLRSLAALKTLSGFSLLAWRVAAPEQARAATDEVAGLLAAGTLRATADTVLPLAEAARAHQLLEDRTVRGRILLIP